LVDLLLFPPFDLPLLVLPILPLDPFDTNQKLYSLLQSSCTADFPPLPLLEDHDDDHEDDHEDDGVETSTVASTFTVVTSCSSPGGRI
jgi:hypothetical protein